MAYLKTMICICLSGLWFQIYAQYTFQQAFPNLTLQRSVDLQHAGDLTDRIFVVDQIGVIRVFQNDQAVNSTKIFLDISDKVWYGGEAGLLGLAFHPDYETNGYFYVNYIAESPLRTVISRFQVSQTNIDSAVKNSEVVILEFSQPDNNHNGGQILFGPDGFLYIGTGDGGGAGDPDNNSQQLTNLLGKILRIDVDNPQPPMMYGIPVDNPFVDSSEVVKKEIFSYGLRNPWRFSIDPVTQTIWCGDVGQGNWEEIDILESGKNYGWRCYEGNHTYNITNCNGNYTFPIWEYSHSVGFSVTGGYVYRGPNLPGLYGKYIYGDYGTTKVWSLEYDGINPAVNTFLANLPGTLPSFGLDQNEELYLLSFNGKIYRFTPTANIIAPSYLRYNFSDSGRINLLWKDNSNNENGFIIERQFSLSDEFLVIDTVIQNITNYSDSINTSGEYTYRIKAFNSNFQSGYSNQAKVRVGIIPVELTNFAGNFENGFANLNWQTASEINNLGFNIERKISGEQWHTTGFVQGNGTTTETHNYFFRDKVNNAKFGEELYYRLKQIDFSGNVNYSDILRFTTDNVASDFIVNQNYPNPFNPITKIEYTIPISGFLKISVYNSLGQLL